MSRLVTAAIVAAIVSGCATNPTVPAAVRGELAPNGKLRAAMNLNNVLLVKKDAASGELRGVSVDLMHELGRRLGVPVEFIGYPAPGPIADVSANNAWDVAMLAIEEARAQTIAFSPPMTEIEATYMVHGDSRLKAAAEVDAPGTRIAAAEKSGYELYLTRTVRHASIVRPKGNDLSFAELKERRVDAWANLKSTLLNYVEKLPGARILEGRFMTVQHGLGTPRDRRAAAEYVRQFVDEMNASGFVARSIERHRIDGLTAIKR
jgi:polar amino acid transport system substrate-binding protein